MFYKIDVLEVPLHEKDSIICNCMLEISNACKAVNSHCLQAIKVVHHHASDRFDWLISGHQSVNPLREAISILAGKCKGFTFVYPVSTSI